MKPRAVPDKRLGEFRKEFKRLDRLSQTLHARNAENPSAELHAAIAEVNSRRKRVLDYLYTDDASPPNIKPWQSATDPYNKMAEKFEAEAELRHKSAKHPVPHEPSDPRSLLFETPGPPAPPPKVSPGPGVNPILSSKPTLGEAAINRFKTHVYTNPDTPPKSATPPPKTPDPSQRLLMPPPEPKTATPPHGITFTTHPKTPTPPSTPPHGITFTTYPKTPTPPSTPTPRRSRSSSRGKKAPLVDLTTPPRSGSPGEASSVESRPSGPRPELSEDDANRIADESILALFGGDEKLAEKMTDAQLVRLRRLRESMASNLIFMHNDDGKDVGMTQYHIERETQIKSEIAKMAVRVAKQPERTEPFREPMNMKEDLELSRLIEQDKLLDASPEGRSVVSGSREEKSLSGRESKVAAEDLLPESPYESKAERERRVYNDLMEAANPRDGLRQAEPEQSYVNPGDPTISALNATPAHLNPAVIDRDLQAARAMAGIPRQHQQQFQQQFPQQPPPQQPGVARGYGGSSFIGNDDIHSQAAGNYNPYPGDGPRGPPAPRPGGDVINPAKASRNNTTDTLRPYFRIGGPGVVSPTEAEQLASRILHVDFGTVAPGSGLGVTNKLFQMNQLREKNIHYMGPMSLPRPYDGPSGLVVPEPLEWQNLITKKDRDTLMSKQIANDLAGVLLESRSGAGSLNITGDDFGQLTSVSARGLKRDADSPLEPIIRLPTKMQRIKLADGFALSHRESRRLFDAQRYPERYETNVAQSGGSTYSRRSALSLYPFPLG